MEEEVVMEVERVVVEVVVVAVVVSTPRPVNCLSYWAESD